MTNPNEHEDLLDNENGDNLRPVVTGMARLHQETTRHRLPAGTDRAIRATLASREPESKRRGAFFLPTRVPRLAWSGALAVVLVVGGLWAYGLVSPSVETVSAATILRRAAGFSVHRGQVVTFLYRDRITYGPGPKGESTNCRARPGTTATTYSRLWLRGRTAQAPQSVVEVAGLGCAPCPLAVVGHTIYRYLYTCGASGPGPGPYGPYLVPGGWPQSNVAENLLYGVSTARMLQRSPKGTSHIRTYRTSLSGHSVYGLEVKNWPGEDPSETITFYFDATSYLLRGADYRHRDSEFPVPLVERVRLVHRRPNAPAPAWGKAVRQLPTYHPAVRVERGDFGADLIGLFNYRTRPRLRVACPGIQGMRARLRSGSGPLGACRTVRPRMTATHLAWLMLRPDIARVWAAYRAGIFPAIQVRASVTFAHREAAQWVTYKKSLSYGPGY